MKKQDSLAITQVNRRLKTLRQVTPSTQVHPGWIRYMREALGMTLKQLATRSKLSLPTVAQAERHEAAGKINLSTLKAMAHALDCELIYAFVSKSDIDVLMREAAIRKAKHILSKTDVHMTLEDQRVNQPLSERVQILADRLLKKGDVW